MYNHTHAPTFADVDLVGNGQLAQRGFVQRQQQTAVNGCSRKTKTGEPRQRHAREEKRTRVCVQSRR